MTMGQINSLEQYEKDCYVVEIKKYLDETPDNV